MSKAIKKPVKKAAPKKRSTAKKAAVKKAIARVVKKQEVKRAAAKSVKHELVVHVDTSPMVPTVTDLAEPMTADGTKALTIRKSWVSESQLHRMLQRTPREQIYSRKGKGGKEFDYVTGSYCIKWLNFIFAWDWDFEVLEHGQAQDHVWALGKLTVRGEKPGQTITKTAFGRSEVKFLTEGQGNNRKRTEKFLDYGNDLKAASTDAMKKAASLLGFASDIYGKMDYKAEAGRDPLPPADPRPSQPAPEEEKVIDYSDPSPIYVCQKLGSPSCGRDITKSEAEFSKRMYSRELCRAHYPKK